MTRSQALPGNQRNATRVRHEESDQFSISGCDTSPSSRWPIEIRIPIDWPAFDAFLKTFNRRDDWPGQPAGLDTGWDSLFDDGDIRANLWGLGRRAMSADRRFAWWSVTDFPCLSNTRRRSLAPYG